MDFKQLAIWQRLQESGQLRHVANVESLLNQAAAMLDRVIETFPTYTLHNARHAFNVANLMGELLGNDGVKRLEPLESAMLLLSAYFHDIGMVFDPKEKETLRLEPEWSEFLQQYPEAFLAMETNTEIPIELAEWYCRWRHADRVFVQLNKLPDNLFDWGQVSIRQELGKVSRSHNDAVKDLHYLDINYLAECDTRFCAIILRLADILDFDSSRAPTPVYRYLQLQRKSTKREAQSDTEWRKHLSSNGFRFPATRSAAYELSIVAGPDDPAVEHDLRGFIDIIGDELRECEALLSSCSLRWRDFGLPKGIDRRSIKSNGYVYGEYRFTLEQHEVLDLLMGENLYDDPYVFVRELLQNAIDTSRHREHVERARGNTEFRATPISVCEWFDDEGYHWVRFDDYGMGMNESIIRNYLLRVGRSYYATAQFRADLLRIQKAGMPVFLPISRFGIGLLSCFVAGDRVEILTVHKDPSNRRDQPARLSLSGLHGFYTLQIPPLRFSPFPGPKNTPEINQKRDFGTSIAVRLDPRKEKYAFDLRSQLNRHLFCPPIAVIFEGELIGGDAETLLDKPWIKRRRVRLSKRELFKLGGALDFAFKKPIQVEFAPIDLTRHSAVGELKGQLIITKHVPSSEWIQLQSEPALLKIRGEVQFDYDGQLSFWLHAIVPHDARARHSADPAINAIVRQVALQGRPTEDGRQIIERLPLKDHAIRIAPSEHFLSGRDPRWLIHNGIPVPTRLPASLTEDAYGVRDRNLWFKQRSDEALWGVISLSDSLRPNVSVARNTLRDLPVAVQSAIELTARRAFGHGSNKHEDFLNRFDAAESRVLRDVWGDKLSTDPRGWPSEQIIKTRSGFKSLNELVQSVKNEAVELDLHSPSSLVRARWISFHDYYAAALAQIGLELEVRWQRDRGVTLIAIGPSRRSVLPAQLLFPPLTFVHMSPDRFAIAPGGFVNIKHKFGRWLMEIAPVLNDKWPGLLRTFRRGIGLTDTKTSRQVLNETLSRLRGLSTDDLGITDSISLEPRDFPKARSRYRRR